MKVTSVYLDFQISKLKILQMNSKSVWNIAESEVSFSR